MASIGSAPSFPLYAEDTNHAGKETKCTHDEREENTGDTKDREERDTKDHCTDVLGSSGFEQVSTTAGTVTDVVPDKVSNGGRVPDVIFRDTGFDFANKICTDISCLGIDTSTELGKEGDKRGTETRTRQ